LTLDKDRIRSAIFGETFTDYTRQQDDLCMRTMIEAAKYLSGMGRMDFILFDGRTFSRKEQVEEVVNAAQSAGAGWRILHLSCSEEVAEIRLRQGVGRHPARNRDLALYKQIQQGAEPILYAKLDIETTPGFETKLESIYSYLHE
jgi:adenylylsulfate kinase